MRNKIAADGYAHAVAITKSDSANFTDGTCDAIYTGDAAADCAVIFAGAASPVTLKALPAGQILRLRLSRVNSTGTSTTNMLALYYRKP